MFIIKTIFYIMAVAAIFVQRRYNIHMMADKALEYTFMFFFLPISQRGTFSVTSYMLSWRRKLSKRDLNIKESDQVGANSFFYELKPTEKGCKMKILVLILKCQKVFSTKLQNKCFAQAISY